MFSTFFKEISGYFDKQAFISAFCPSFIFWGSTFAVIFFQRSNLESNAAAWGSLGSFGQFLYVLAFFVWTAFWAFLILNFHSFLLRFFQGELQFPPLVNWLRKRWQKRWKALKTRDDELETREIELLATSELKDFVFSISGQPINELPDLAAAAENATKIKDLLDSADKSRHDQSLKNSADKLLEAWQIFVPYRKLEKTDTEWKTLVENLDELTKLLLDKSQAELDKSAEERLQLHHKFFLKFPQQCEEVKPTELGNVLEAADSRIRLRYNLDAPLFWPRLQGLLPKEVNETIQGARTSLNLMLTLAFGILLFGLPLTISTTFQSETYFAWWLPLIFGGLNILFRQYWVASLCLCATGLSYFLYFQDRATPATVRMLLDLQPLLTGFGGLYIFSWLCYRNAVESSLIYGEKLQSAFDLYRWKILEELHLQLPPNLEEEREIWGDLGGLIYRGYSPSSDYYRYVIDEKKVKLPRILPEPQVPVIVLKKNLPAFHLVNADDVSELKVPPEQVPFDAVTEPTAVVGKLLLSRTTAKKPISKKRLQAPDKLKNYLALGLSVSPENILGGIIDVGDHVDLWINPKSEINGDQPEPIAYQDVLVLQTTLNDDQSETDTSLTADSPQIIIVALPSESGAALVGKLTNASILVARKISPG